MYHQGLWSNPRISSNFGINQQPCISKARTLVHFDMTFLTTLTQQNNILNWEKNPVYQTPLFKLEKWKNPVQLDRGSAKFRETFAFFTNQRMATRNFCSLHQSAKGLRKTLLRKARKMVLAIHIKQREKFSLFFFANIKEKRNNFENMTRSITM